MIDLPVAAPSNRFLVHQRDRRWPRVLSSVLLVAAVVLWRSPLRALRTIPDRMGSPDVAPAGDVDRGEG